MSEEQKQQLQNDELGKVSGGGNSPSVIPFIVDCSKCHTQYDTTAPLKEVHKMCGKNYYEYQCPKCGAWNRSR